MQFCGHLFGLKDRIYSFVEDAMYELRWRRVRSRCVLLVFCGFLTLHSLRIYFDRRKSLAFAHSLKNQKIKTYI